jgi:hypothetical protein
MKKYLNFAGKTLLIAGLFEIAIGLMHFVMPYFALQSKGFALLNQDEQNSITLCVLAVGILVTGFGILTVLFSLKKESVKEMLLYYCVISSILFLFRVIFEILFPVKISLFYIENPTIAVLPLLIFVWLLFVVSTVFVAMSNKIKNT